MREWIKANGGPPAIIVLGLGLISLNLYLGLTVAVIGLLYWIYKSSWFPYTFAKKNEISATRSDLELVALARSVVKSIDSLFGQHVRYRPPFHSENEEDIGGHAAWARGVNRSINRCPFL